MVNPESVSSDYERALINAALWRPKHINLLSQSEICLYTMRMIRIRIIFINIISDIEGSDIYQLVLLPWKNIVPSQNYRRSKVAYV